MPARLASLAALVAVSTTGLAQAQGDPYAMAHAAAANQLGVMEYCQGRGDVGTEAVAAQRGAMARLPGPAGGNEADEALGRQGTLAAPNGTRTTLDSLASAHGSTVSALCKQMGSAAAQSAAMVQQNGMAAGGMAVPGRPAMPAMPTLPSGMTMPTLPSGMTMPGAVPGAVPAAPR